jgi:hypothetical protein
MVHEEIPMNCVEKALQEIKFRIPSELLSETFIARTFDPVIGPEARRQLPVSIDYLIRQHVIEARVIPDTNLVGGIEVNIPLYSLVANNIDRSLVYNSSNPWMATYRVPKDLTQGRVITRIVSLTIGQGAVAGMGGMGMGMGGASPLLDAASGVLASALPIPIVSTAYVQMIGENTFMVDDNMMMNNNVWMRCIVEADSSFSHLNPTQWHNFARLCEYATKAYIYNKLIIEVGMAQLVGGQELGKFKEVLEGYSDATENYMTFLDDIWKVSQTLSDPNQKRRHLKMLVGGSN